MPLHTRSQTGDERSRPRRGYRVPVIWWILSISLMSGFQSADPGSRSTLIPVTSQTILSEPGDWHIPFAHFEYTRAWGSSQWVVMALMSSLTIAVFAQQLARVWGSGATILVVAALSIGLRDIHVIPCILLGLLTYLFFLSRRSQHVVVGWIPAFLFFLTILTTLEYGFVFFFWGSLVLPPMCLTRTRIKISRSVMWSSCLSLVAIVIGCFHNGFCLTLFRPINWLNVGVYPEVLDSLRPSFSLDLSAWPNLLLLSAMFACWILVLNSAERVRQYGLCMLVFTLLGVFCSYYLWLSTAAVGLCLIAPCENASQATPSRYVGRYLLATSFLILLALMVLFGPGSLLRSFVSRGTVPNHRIDPALWRSHGGVILFNLDRSSVWQNPLLAEKYQLIIDDRWELHRSNYQEYAAVVRDLKEMRSLPYFRTDQKFGGYSHQIKLWDPSLLVADSRDSEAIRNLSLSQRWKMMGIDAESTYFGNLDNSANRGQIQQAAHTFLGMEWPTDHFPANNIDSIVASFPSDRNGVSEILSAIRLPYAALRLLADEDSVQNRKVKAWSYLELAHRVYRNTGHHSLIDESRASLLIHQLSQNNQWLPQELASLKRGCEGIYGDHFLELFSDSSVTSDEKRFPKTSKPIEQSAEEILRNNLRLGRMDAAEKSLSQVSSEVRPFYEVFLRAQHDSLEDKAKSFYEVSQNANLAPRLKSELLFYLGCIAIEVGDREVAIEALSQSESIQPQSVLTPIRSTYLRQLQSP